jgi:hypothetical protein
MVAIGISELERRQQLLRGLVRVDLQAMKHFCPIGFKWIRVATSHEFSY